MLESANRLPSIKCELNSRKLRLIRLAFVFFGIILIALLILVLLTRFPFKISTSDVRGRVERSVAEMYDQDNLAACCLFAGNYINFGYWDSLSKNPISVAERIESQKNLYRFVAKSLNITFDDRVLEVACGQGVGAALVADEFNPKEIKGIDLSEEQISRAKKLNAATLQKNLHKISFDRGAAENIPQNSDIFDKIMSIEAAQHFENLDLFSKEANRVLKPGGKLAIASFFGTSEKSERALASMIQTIESGIDRARPIQDVKRVLQENGFKNIIIKSIGDKVWHGFDRWTSQTNLKDSWTRNWYNGYQEGLVDYYLIIAEKA